MIEFRTLPHPVLRDPTDGIDFDALLSRSKLIALLAYLALTRPNGFQPRDRLMALFWPESSQNNARRSLAQALYELRRYLGSDVIKSRNGQVALDSDRVWCDANAFEEHIEAGALTAALELYEGDLLDGFSLPGCTEFELWLDERRWELRAAAVKAARIYACQLADAGQEVEAAFWWRRLLLWEPYDEKALVELIRCLGAIGDRTGAVREYETFAERLRADIGIDPPDELRERIDEIRASRGPPASPAQETTSTTESIAQSPLAGSRDDGDSRLVIAVAAVVITGLLVTSLAVTRWNAGGKEAVAALDPQLVLIGDIENRTGDPTLQLLGSMVSDWIAQDLSQAGFVRPVRPGLFLPKPRDRDRSPAAVRDLARDLGAAGLITGSIDRRVDSLSFAGWVVDVETGEVLRTVRVTSSIEIAPETAASELRKKIVGALATTVDPRLKGWSMISSQPPSFEAYRLYSEALSMLFEHRSSRREAGDLLEKAGSIDSTFTAPLLWAIHVHRHSGRWARADSLVELLRPRLDDLPPWDRGILEFYIGETEDPARAYRSMKQVLSLAPQSEWVLQLAQAAFGLSRFEEAIELLEDADMEQGWLGETSDGWYLLVTARHMIGDDEAALRDAIRAEGQYPGAGKYLRLRALVGLGRVEESIGLLREIVGPPSSWGTGQRWPDIHYLGLAQELLVHGDAEAARRVVEEYFERWEPYRPADAVARVPVAGLHELAGRPEEALREVERIPDEPRYQITRIGYDGLLAAKLGDRSSAREALRRLDTLDTASWDERLDTRMWRIKILAQLGDLDGAVGLIRESMEQGYGALAVWHYDHQLQPLRSYPPYQALLMPRG